MIKKIKRYQNIDASLYLQYMASFSKQIQMSKRIKRYQNSDASLYLQYKAGVCKQTKTVGTLYLKDKI